MPTLRAPLGLSGWLSLSATACVPVLLLGCSDLIPPDPYRGTIDSSSFDTAFGGPSKSSWPNGVFPCLAPRRGFGGGPSGIDGQTWWYMGGLSASQLDLSNAADPAKALPPSVYEVTGCEGGEGKAEPIRRDTYDARIHNYLTDRQYPVVSYGNFPAQVGAAGEPTSVGSYRPWHVVVPVALRDSVRGRMGCNDIKSERSLLERAGWSRETKAFPENAPYNMDLRIPTREDIRAGRVTFRDWPMMSVATVLMKTPVANESCPTVSGSMAQYPKFPGDPSASFQFPQQHWLRGLLGGYLDGGDVPTTTDPVACADILRYPTGKSCAMTSECNAAANEICTGGRCQAPIPVCPQLNELFVDIGEVPLPTSATLSNPIQSATVDLKDPMDDKKVRKGADILAIFSAVPGDAAYSPVCRLRFFDKKKVTCAASEPTDLIAPRPLCSAKELKAQPDALVTKDSMGKALPNYYVHCLFQKRSQ